MEIYYTFDCDIVKIKQAFLCLEIEDFFLLSSKYIHGQSISHALTFSFDQKK